MTTHQLEPTPGWCERAYKALRASYCIDTRGASNILAEYEAAQQAKPAEPQPHEWRRRKGENFPTCRHCGVAMYGQCPEPVCPARAQKPEVASKPHNPSSSTTNAVDSPQPEPLGRELEEIVDTYGWCRHCGQQVHVARRDKPCAERARAPKPEAEKAQDPRIVEAWPYPEPEKAELPAELAKAIRQHSDEVGSAGRRWELEDLCRLLLAEARKLARKLAREEVDKHVSEDAHWTTDEMHSFADERIAAATLEIPAGTCVKYYGNNRFDVFDAIGKTRLKPGAREP